MLLRRSLSLLLFGLTCVRPAVAQRAGRPLTAAQVACEERQLGRLVHRMAVSYDGSNLFLWRSAPTGGVYRGLATTSRMLPAPDTGHPTREEEQLTFDLLVKPGEDFLDPRRQLLPQATLVRRDAATNLSPEAVAPMASIAPGRLDVTLDLAPVVPDPTQPGRPLRVTDRLAPGAGESDGAGRALETDALLAACHAEVSALDLQVYAILARTVRASDCLLQPLSHCDAGRFRFKSVLFRGEDPLTYRMNLYSYSVACDDSGHCSYGEGQVALLFHLQLDSVGRLSGGDVEALPWCTGADAIGCTPFLNPDLAVFVLPPLRPGLERQGDAAFGRAAHLNLEFRGSENNVLTDTVRWSDLLRDSSWNEGFKSP